MTHLVNKIFNDAKAHFFAFHASLRSRSSSSGSTLGTCKSAIPRSSFPHGKILFAAEWVGNRSFKIEFL